MQIHTRSTSSTGPANAVPLYPKRRRGHGGKRRRWGLLMCLVVALGGLPGGRTSAGETSWPSQTPATVVVQDGKLSVWLHDADLRQVLEAITVQGQLRVTVLGQVRLPQRTIAFEGLPLEEGLRRLLHGTSFSLVTAHGAAAPPVTHVFVMASPSDQVEPSTATVEAGALREHEEALRRTVAHTLPTVLQRVLAEHPEARAVSEHMQQVIERLPQGLTPSQP